MGLKGGLRHLQGIVLFGHLIWPGHLQGCARWRSCAEDEGIAGALERVWGAECSLAFVCALQVRMHHLQGDIWDTVLV